MTKILDIDFAVNLNPVHPLLDVSLYYYLNNRGASTIATKKVGGIGFKMNQFIFWVQRQIKQDACLRHCETFHTDSDPDRYFTMFITLLRCNTKILNTYRESTMNICE